jgi:limonene-1,2-epoxide hydrolase
MTPRELVNKWVEVFNTADAEVLASMYSEDAVNHQVNQEPVTGRESIKKFFVKAFAEAEMICIIENVFEDREWAILEWKDPLGLRGCGFFHIKNDRIVFQRGYWDLLTFLKQHHLPIPGNP